MGMGHIHAPSSLTHGPGPPPADLHCPDMQDHQSQPETEPITNPEMQKDSHKPACLGRPLTSTQLSLCVWPHGARAEGAKSQTAGSFCQAFLLSTCLGSTRRNSFQVVALGNAPRGPQMRQEFKAGLLEFGEWLLPKPPDPTFQGPRGPQASPCPTGYRPRLHMSSAS